MNQKAKSLSAIVFAAKRLRYTTQLARKHLKMDLSKIPQK
jgi:hypothetical protein